MFNDTKSLIKINIERDYTFSASLLSMVWLTCLRLALVDTIKLGCIGIGPVDESGLFLVLMFEAVFITWCLISIVNMCWCNE